MNMKQILNHTALTKARLSILSASITALICSSVYASDIDIYKAPTTGAGATTVLFMLDKSGSMNFTDYGNTVTYDEQNCPSKVMMQVDFRIRKLDSSNSHIWR
jgi:type IV pilus assembly protein PilY1